MEKRKTQKKRLLLEDGQGDIRLYSVATPDQDVPKGTLYPLPGNPGFATLKAAEAFLASSGDKYIGLTIAVLHFRDLVAVEVRTSHNVRLNKKPRITKQDDEE